MGYYDFNFFEILFLLGLSSNSIGIIYALHRTKMCAVAEKIKGI